MFLGIDIGTSGVKAALVDRAGRVAADATAPLTVSRPRPLWSEQDPSDWVRATDEAVLALDARLRGRVESVGLAGQMHGATLLDASDRVLRPAILWNDGRSSAECAAFEAAAPRLRVITGNRAMAGFTAPKLQWVRAHEKDVFSAVRTVLLPKDYVRLRMTGDKASDMSDASGTLWLDVGARRWSSELLAATGLDERAMPKLYEGDQATGRLSSETAARWGMARVPVAAGGGDNAAAAVGLGVTAPGEAFLSLGTSGVIFVATDQFRPNAELAAHAFAHALPSRWHQMSVMLSAAACLDWAAALLGFSGVAALLTAAESASGESRIVFLPYIAGERTPHDDPHSMGVYFGLAAADGRAEAARATLEGVAMGLCDGMDALLAAGSDIGALRVTGGGARSLFWGRIIASALGRPLHYSAQGNLGPAYGAARLARLAATGERVSDICAAPATERVIAPEPRLQESLAARQTRFRQLYRDLRQSFRSP